MFDADTIKPTAKERRERLEELALAVGGADDLIRLLGASRIGRTVEVSILRNGRIERLTVTPAERRA